MEEELSQDLLDSGDGAWIERARNREVWARIVDVLTLHEGFSVHIVVVPGSHALPGPSNTLAQLAVARGLPHASYAVESADPSAWRPEPRPSAVESLLAHRGAPCIATLTTCAWPMMNPAYHPRPEDVRVALMQVNQRRDVLAAELDGPLFIFVDRDTRDMLIEVAHDLWSVRINELWVESGRPRRPVAGRGRWLSAHELAGMCGLLEGFGHSSATKMVSVSVPVPAPVELLEREQHLADLRDESTGPTRLLVLSGFRGSGRRALAARFVADEGQRWDQVVWLDMRHEEQTDAGIFSVLATLRPDLPPPVTRRELHLAYLRETSARRVLIVVACQKNFTEDWPAPGKGSFALVISGQRVGVRRRVVGLISSAAALTLWRRLSDESPPEGLADSERRHLPGTVVWGARIRVRPLPPLPDIQPLASQWYSPYGGKGGSEGAGELWRRLARLPPLAQGLPRALLSESEAQELELLIERGIVTVEGEWIKLLECDRFTFRDMHTWGELGRIEARGGTQPPLPPEFHLRLLRLARLSLSDVLMRMGAGMELELGLETRRSRHFTHTAVFEDIAEVLLPHERGAFLDQVLRHTVPERQGPLTAIALRTALEQHNHDQAYRLLHDLRRLPDAPSCDHLALELALQTGDDIQTRAYLDLDLAPQARARFERAWSGAELEDWLARLHASEGDPEPARTAQTPAADHFAWLSLALRALERHDAAMLDEARAGVRRSAEAWGAALAYLRADRLDAEADLLAGRELDALTKLDELIERWEAYRGVHDFSTIELLFQRLQLSARFRPAAEALRLADACLQRVREADLALPELFEDLARLYLEHARYDLAKQATRRWKLAAGDDTLELERARAFAREIARHRYEAELREC